MFGLDPDVIPLNHASYGIPTVRTLDLAERFRREIEREPMAALGDALTERLDAATATAAEFCGLPAAGFGLTANATDGAAAVQRALAGRRVVSFGTECASVARGWDVAGEHARVPIPLPIADADEVLAALDGVECDVLQVSLVTSSAAVAMPIARLGDWTRSHGARLVVDCAHGPGHVGLEAVAEWADFAFGTLHKWLPLPRGVGFAWAREPDVLRPAAVSLSWDEPTVARRFAWPGTYDPVPRLCIPDAIEQWRAWDFTEAVRLADRFAAECGLQPSTEMVAPRLRSFIAAGAPPLDGIQVWSDGHLLRIATHVYSTGEHVDTILTNLVGKP